MSRLKLLKTDPTPDLSPRTEWRVLAAFWSGVAIGILFTSYCIPPR